MNTALQQLGERAAQARVQKGWTQAELAVRAGVSKSSVSNFERTGVTTTTHLYSILHHLGRTKEFMGLFQAVEEYSSLDDFEKANQPVKARRVRKRR
jgi:transcriptional regulator with XRE-family HTH domain